MKRFFCAGWAAVLLAASSLAMGQSYPTKPIHIIVAFAPGGPVDVLSRLIAIHLPEYLDNQPVIIENRPSVSGNLGSAVVAKADPDGYTLLANSSAIAVNATLFSNPGYDVLKDFMPIAQLATQPNVIVVNASFPAKNLKELLEIAKGGKLAYASPGTGTTPHLTAEHLFRLIAKVDIVHVPHKGAGPAAAAVVAGEPPVGSLAVTAPLPYIRSGRVRALAISSSQRNPQLPDVPTFVELGYPDLQDYTWVGLFAPAGTPPEVVKKLNEAVNRSLQAADVKQRLEDLTFEPIGGSSQQFGDYLKSEVAKWGKVVKETGARAD